MDGDGREFSSGNGAASITGAGTNNEGNAPGTPLWTPAQFMNRVIVSYQNQGDTVTYKAVNGDIVVVSGTTPKDKIFYERDVVYSRVIYQLFWSYPTAEKAQFDSLVDHTAATFTPGPDHGG